MRSARRRIQESPPQGGTLLLNLSLFLMLLSFFIILNNVSTFEEEKYRPVMQSLRSTFSTTVMRRDDAANPSVTPDPLQSINEGQTIERIDALFRAQITGFQAETSMARGVMAVSMKLEEFDRAVNSPAQIDLTQRAYGGGLQTFFVPTLVSLIQAREQGTPYRMDMVFHTADAPALLFNSDPRALETFRQKAASYAAMLEAAGLPPALIGVAMMQGDPATISLIFRPVEATP